MIDELSGLLKSHRQAVYLFFRHLKDLGQALLLQAEVVHEYDTFLRANEQGRSLAETPLSRVMSRTQEIVVANALLYLAVRVKVARWKYFQIHTEEMEVREISVSEFLAAKERIVAESDGQERYILELDLRPFERGFPKLSEARSIGRGVEYLNRHLSGRIFQGGAEGARRLFEFLKVHEARGKPLMLNGTLESVDELREALRQALEILSAQNPDEDGWSREIKRLGFEVGWGRTTRQITESMHMLSDILEAPSASTLESFLSRIPMIFSITILSPHGYLAQSNVLGMPDTGGQVVYILDQVRALERAMRHSIHEQGLDIEPQIVVLTRLIPEAGGTTCDQRLEPILGTENARILRVPFRDRRGDVIPQWISRFQIWPHLERFAVDAERELLAELGGRPDFIIGNYSDGNLVASIMAHRLGVTQCNIAHALEKTKYPGSDLHWKEHDEQYHFPCQYTADLIAMNTADFIITSTYQEIAGTAETVGQYESYQAFTMPELYRVVGGVDCFDPKFNIVSPGADADVFFPYWEMERRMETLRDEIRSLLYGEPGRGSRGKLADPGKPILLAMSRLDQVKNMSGFLKWYAESEELRGLANVLLVGGHVDPELSADTDERRQIEDMHRLFDEYDLDGQVRWLEMQTDKNRVGEIYRSVADTGGAFVQPALFEAFGLTVVEAMSSGLPTFATCYGGPSEVIVNDVSGFHIDPMLGEDSAARMVEFLRTACEDPERWRAVSKAAVERVAERYNWDLYAHKLLALSRIYGFWRYITSLEREETVRYLEMFYALMYRPLAQRVASSASA